MSEKSISNRQIVKAALFLNVSGDDSIYTNLLKETDTSDFGYQ